MSGASRRQNMALTRRLPNAEALRVSEAREFKGGLNTFDTPLNLNTRFLIEARNIYPDTNGRLRLRYGTSLFADAVAHIDEIIGIEYFNTALVAVGRNGHIVSIDGAGNVTVRWNAAIASSLPNSPPAWSTGLEFCSFTQFAGLLIICNGVDKPLIMNELYEVEYLIDVGSGSNVNVPRAKYCATHNNYLVLAVEPGDATTLFIGMRGVAGTFVGDPGPDNDAVNFVTNTYVNRGSPDITGISSFRDKLIVSFAETLLAITLGNYDTSSPPNHIPRVDDVIENHGAVSHRCIVPLGDDILFLDQAGMASVQRALITATLSPVRESTLIGEDIQTSMAPFTPAQLERHVFAVHDRIAQHILFFVPKDSNVQADTDNNVFVYCFDRAQRFRAWSYFDQMAYRCGTRSTEGRIFLAQGSKVFFYHNQFNPLYNDYAVPGEQLWDSGQPWDDGTGWEEPLAAVGAPIPFSFSLPWTDFNRPGRLKLSKYIGVSAEGDGEFTLQMFIDDFAQPEMGMTFQQTIIPASTSLTARPSNNSQLYAWPQKFEKMRLRVVGQTNSYIAFVALSVMFLNGSVRR